MAQDINATISNLIANQFPPVYKEDGPLLVAFIQAYYEWLEQPDNPVGQARSLFVTADVDRTLEVFFDHFTATYLSGIQFDTVSDKRLTVKRILDLYRAKGSIRALKLLFQLVFGEDIDVYLPGADILKPSNGDWKIPIYLEVSPSQITPTYVGRKITGQLSGATAYVEQLLRRSVQSRYIDVLIISGVSSNIPFITGEPITIGDNIAGAPSVIGSLTTLIVEERGIGYAIGDLVDLQSIYGVEGQARVTAIDQVTGIVQFTLIDGGWGYTNNYSNVLISTTVLSLSNIIDQINANSAFIPTFADITLYCAANSAVANVTANNIAVSPSMTLFATKNAGSFLAGETIATANAYLPATTGVVVGTPTNDTYVQLNLTNLTGSFVYPENVTQTGGTVGQILAANSSALILTSNVGAFSNSVQIVGAKSGATANITTGVVSGTTISVANVNNDFFPDVTGIANVQIVGQTSGATANVISFTGSVGVIGLTGSLSNSYTDFTATFPAVLTVSSISGTVFPGEIVYQQKSGTNNSFGIVTGSNSSSIAYLPNNGAIFYATNSTYSNAFIDTANAAMSSNIGAFKLGERVTQNNGAVGILLSANSTTLVFSTTNGTFSTSNNIVGALSGANAVISSITNFSRTVSANITAVVPTQKTVTAWINSFSTGVLANFSVGNINVTENIFYYSDFIGANNAGGTPYILLPLNALAYGFPKFPVANASVGYLVDILNMQILQIGEIENIVTTNPGVGYNVPPLAEVYQAGVYSQLKQDYNMTIVPVNHLLFNVGDEIDQAVPIASWNALNLAVNSTFTIGETLYQVNTNPTGTYSANIGNTLVTSTLVNTSILAGQTILLGNTDIRTVNNVVNTTAFYLTSAPYTTNATANVYILKSTGQFVQVIPNTSVANVIYYANGGPGAFVSGSNVVGLSSKTSINVTGVATIPYGLAKGRIKTISGNNFTVKRMSLNQDFSALGQAIVDQQTGATANIAVVTIDPLSGYAGYNANVATQVTTANGSVASLNVVSSGLGFVNGETVTFVSSNNKPGTAPGTAETFLGQQGIGTGYYSSTRGFTSADKYIQDGTFYQNYSYQIRASRDISTYKQMVKNVCHVAGTALFGAVVKQSVAAAPLDIPSYSTGPTQTVG